MELLEVYRCPEFIYPVIFAAKFKHVKNAGAIRQRIVKAATMEGPEGDKERDAVNFAFINAKLVSAFSCSPRRTTALIHLASRLRVRCISRPLPFRHSLPSQRRPCGQRRSIPRSSGISTQPITYVAQSPPGRCTRDVFARSRRRSNGMVSRTPRQISL